MACYIYLFVKILIDMIKRKYKVSLPNCGGIPSEEESQFFADKLNTTPDNILVIYDATDENGEWLEEIWDEEDAGFPIRVGDYKKTHMEYYFFSYWEIYVPWIGQGILVQDASPIGIAFKKDDLEKCGMELIYTDNE